MKTNEALKIVGGLSKPSKMPGWAYGLQLLSVKQDLNWRRCRAQSAAAVMP